MEAAFALPIVMVLILLLLQPAIVFYDRIVMESAAAEGCRLLATAGEAERGAPVDDYIRRRLSAIPQTDLFHIHGADCSYVIDCEGDENADAVQVSIRNELAPLPLLDGAMTLLGATNGAGHLEIEVVRRLPTQPAWMLSAHGSTSPQDWVGAWLDE